MRTMISLFFTLLVAASPALANGNTNSATAKTSAFIAPPIKIMKIQDLWFGELILNDADMVVDTFIEQEADKSGGTRSADQPSFLTVIKKFERWHNARFEVTGLADTAYTFVIPQPKVLLYNTNNQTATLYLDSTRFNTYLGGSALDAEGKATIWVGGRLNLTGKQAPGLYSADFEVCVAYY